MLPFTSKFLRILNPNNNKTVLISFCQYATIKENKIQIGNQTINYVKEGNGAHSILCFPGALGTIWSDFKPQIQKLDKSKFTVVAWDTPGCGRSRPPNRVFNKDFYKNDADIAMKFMKAIGIPKFSILGWSDGGTSAMILAAKYPEAVNKLVTWGSNAYLVESEYAAFEKFRDVNLWSDRMRDSIELYGSEGMHNIWDNWFNAIEEIYKNGGDICKKELKLIKCPTLILHGDKDPLVAPEHPEYLVKKIKNAKLHRFPDGKHSIHLTYDEQFNNLVTKFLLE